MYGSVIRFYNTILSLKILELMKEDIIELISRMVFTQPLSNMTSALCRICTMEEERAFNNKIIELG
jgi:hypothetical protein